MFANPPAVPTPTLQPTTAGVSRRILLVDDSSMLRKVIKTFLLPARVELTTATNGLEALNLVAEAQGGGRPFDLILMDVVMPELNGVEATHRLRQQGYTGKIVILTAADEFDMASSLCAGADDYLAKPFTPEDLLNTIGAHCAAPCAAA